MVVSDPGSPRKLLRLQRRFSRAVLLRSSGLSGVLLPHRKFPGSAKLPFFHLILKYFRDAAHSALMLSFETVIMKKIKEQKRQLQVYVLTERAVVFGEVILWLCCSQALGTLQKSAEHFPRETTPVQQGSAESIPSQILLQTNKLSAVV